MVGINEGKYDSAYVHEGPSLGFGAGALFGAMAEATY